MAGHNKWSKIKRKKGVNDAKRGKLFTRFIREITVAAREGGGSLEGNPRLSTAVNTAKSNSMPLDNIERAIKKGTGEIEGVNYEEHSYEGYGPGGAAIMLDVMTDNKQRTTAEVRHLFSKFNGNLGEPNSVAWNFDLKGLIHVTGESLTEDNLMELAIEAGADDVQSSEEGFEIYTDPSALFEVKNAIEGKPDIHINSAERVRVPKNTVDISESDAQTLLKLLDHLEDNDDVVNVYANSEIPQEILDALEE